MSENKERSALGQAAELITFTPIEAPTRFPGYHLDCICGARLIVGAYIVVICVRRYNLRCVACQWPRTSSPQRLLDYAIMAQAPAVRSAGFSWEHCGAPGVETRHWAPQNLFRDYNTWPTVQLCPACHALWHNIMRAGTARL